MAIKRSEQLFGDDAVHGPRSPIETTAPPGMGTDNRAIKLGEEITSGSYNRITYALALNDDDLEDRIAVFESGGLDTVYRLGLADVAGGGRIITIDGGAFEAKADAASAPGDRAQALVRANTEEAALDGLVGFDFVARSGGTGDAAPGAALFGFMDRRLVVIDTDATTLAAEMTGTLSGSRLLITTADCYWAPPPPSSSTFTDLMVGHDLVEVVSSPYAGTYLLQAVGRTSSGVAAYAELQRLDGVMLNAAPNTPATFRVYRPVFISAGKVRAAALRSGVVIAGLPSDSLGGAALTLVPGQVGPEPRAEQGVAYALAVQLRADEGGAGGLEEIGITALGTYHARNPQSVFGASMPSSFAKPLAGFRYANEHASGNGAAFLAHHKAEGAAPFVGVAVQERRTGARAATFDTDKIVLEPSVDDSSQLDWSVAEGSLVEIWVGDQEYGTYRVREARSQGMGQPSSPKILWLESLGGDLVSTFPATGSCTVYLLEGSLFGTYTLPFNYGYGPGTRRITASIAGTIDPGIGDNQNTEDEHVVLQLANQSGAAGSYLLRGVNTHTGGDNQSKQVFAVKADGEVLAPKITAKNVIVSEDVNVESVVYAAAFLITNVTADYKYAPRSRIVRLPWGMWRSDSTSSAWFRDPITGRLRLGDSYGNNDAVSASLSGWLPSTARLLKVELAYAAQPGAYAYAQLSRDLYSTGRTLVVGDSLDPGGSPAVLEPVVSPSMDLATTDPYEITLRTLGVVASGGGVNILSVYVSYTYDAVGL
jgi:hypothetical protein